MRKRTCYAKDGFDTVWRMPNHLQALIWQYVELTTLMSCRLLNHASYISTQQPTLWKTLSNDVMDENTSKEEWNTLITFCANVHGTHLTTISLSNLPITHSVWRHLALRSQNLIHLKVNHMKSIKDDVMTLFARNNLLLQSLHAVQCVHLTDLSLKAIEEYCTTLLALHMGHCKLLTDKGVISAIQSLPHLLHVHFQGCPKIGKASLTAMGQHCPHIQVIQLNGSGAIDDQSLYVVAKHSKELQILDISSSNPFGGNRHVTDAALSEVLQNCLLLTTLKIKGFQGLTPHLLKAFAGTHLDELDVGGCRSLTRCPELIAPSLASLSLHTISFWSCIAITDDVVLELKEYCPLLQHMDLDGCSVSNRFKESYFRHPYCLFDKESSSL